MTFKHFQGGTEESNARAAELIAHVGGGGGGRGEGASASDVAAIEDNVHNHATLAFSEASRRPSVGSVLQDGFTGIKPVCPRHHRSDEDEAPSDPPGEEHTALPAGLPLLSFIPLLPPSPTTSL